LGGERIPGRKGNSKGKKMTKKAKVGEGAKISKCHVSIGDAATDRKVGKIRLFKRKQEVKE